MYHFWKKYQLICLLYEILTHLNLYDVKMLCRSSEIIKKKCNVVYETHPLLFTPIVMSIDKIQDLTKIQHKKLHYILKFNDMDENFNNVKFPINTYSIALGLMYNHEIHPGVLPPNLRTLIFSMSFDKSLEVGIFPQHLTTLIFGLNFNQKIKHNVLPRNLHTLDLGIMFNQELLPGVLPENLHTLIFSEVYNISLLKGSLSPKLHHLSFGCNFNKKIDIEVLPRSLDIIEFGYFFQQKLLVDILPPNLSTISLYQNYKYKKSLILDPKTKLKILENPEYKEDLNIMKYFVSLKYEYLIEMSLLG